MKLAYATPFELQGQKNTTIFNRQSNQLGILHELLLFHRQDNQQAILHELLVLNRQNNQQGILK